MLICRTSARAVFAPPARNSGHPPFPYQRDLTIIARTNATRLNPSFFDNVAYEVRRIQARHPRAELFQVFASNPGLSQQMPLKRISLHFVLPDDFEMVVRSIEDEWGSWNAESIYHRVMEAHTMTWDDSFMDVTLARDLLDQSQFAGHWFLVVVKKSGPNEQVLRPERVYYEFIIHGAFPFPHHARQVCVDAIDGEVIQRHDFGPMDMLSFNTSQM